MSALFLALEIPGADGTDPDDLADEIAFLLTKSINDLGRPGRVRVHGIPAPQWLTPETLENLRRAANGG